MADDLSYQRELKFFPRTFRGSDGTVSGVVAECSCGCPVFYVFQVDGQDHPHLQCRKCGEAFCPSGGECQGGAH